MRGEIIPHGEVDAMDRAGERLFQAEIDVHGDAAGRLGPWHVETTVFDIQGAPGIDAEQPHLLDGLRRAAAAKARGPVSRDEHQGQCLIIGLDDGRQQLGGCGAGGGDHGHGAAVHHHATEREEAGAALIKEVPQLHAGAGEQGGDERGVARTGGDAYFADSQLGEVEEGGLGESGIHGRFFAGAHGALSFCSSTSSFSTPSVMARS